MKRNKRSYEAPQIEIVRFDVNDVIFESDNYTPWNNQNPSI